MKASLLTLLLISQLSGISYIQYYKVESTNCTKTDSNFVYENDSVKITYTLWANGGAMSFVIFNKMGKPLYVDWERSSMIVNAVNHFYFSDSLAEMSYSHTAVGFLPPKTQLQRSMSRIVTKNIAAWSSFETQTQTRNDTKNTQTKIYVRKFTADNSPVVFRNFLTLSDRKDFQNTFSVDNKFYISEVQAMDVRNFMRQTGENAWEFFYWRGTDFYLN